MSATLNQKRTFNSNGHKKERKIKEKKSDYLLYYP